MSLSAFVTQKGQPVTLNGSFADAGAPEADTVHIVWGDGSTDTLNLPAAVHSFSDAHVYAGEGDYFPTVFVTNADGGTAAAAAEEQIVAAPFQTVLDVTGQPGQTVSGTVTNAPTGDVLQVNLTLNAADSSAGEFLGVQFTHVQLPPEPGVLQTFVSYDFRQHDLGPNDSVLVTLDIRGQLGFGATPVLFYLDPTTHQEQVFHGLFRVVQEPNELVVSIVFNNGSTPTLGDMTQTVFTIVASVPGGTASAAVSSAVVSASATATAPVATATFQSSSQLRLTLATTQLSQVSQSLSSLGDSGGSGSDGPSADDDALAQLVVKQLQSLWPYSEPILRFLTPPPQGFKAAPDAPAQPESGPSAPQAPDVPGGKESHSGAQRLLGPGPHAPAPGVDHKARAAVPASVAAAAVGLVGVRFSKQRRKQGERRASTPDWAFYR